MLDSWVREHVQTSLQGIAKKTRQDGKYRSFGIEYGMNPRLIVTFHSFRDVLSPFSANTGRCPLQDVKVHAILPGISLLEKTTTSTSDREKKLSDYFLSLVSLARETIFALRFFSFFLIFSRKLCRL